MKKSYLSILILTLLAYCNGLAQSSLTIEKIMKGEYFTGFSPENIQWSPQGKIFFSWNPGMAPLRSTFVCDPGGKPAEATIQQKKDLPGYGVNYNSDRSKAVWAKDGDIFLLETKTGKVTRLTSSVAPENSPSFSMKGDKIIFNSQGNIFSLETGTGILSQHTDFRQGRERTEVADKNSKDKWLNDDEMRLINTLQDRKKRRELAEKESESLKPARPKAIYSGAGMISSPQLSPDQNFVTYFTVKPAEEKRTIVPNYVTESSYTEDIQSRGKVGTTSYSSGALNIYDIRKDTVYQVAIDDIPGIDDKPDYVKDYPARKTEKGEKQAKRGLSLSGPVWSADGKFAATDLYSEDHKDRWIMLLDINTGKLKLLDRQRDEAWIGGPGIGRGSLGWLADNKTLYFQSEATGYSHLYTIDVTTGEKKALTSGNFEVSDLKLSNDKKTFYFISNETDPGIMELYSMPANGGSRIKLTDTGGAVEYELSPDEKYFALRISNSNTPWELFTMENKKNSKPVRVTESATVEFNSYKWRVPEVIRVKASDGAAVPARLYKPVKKNGAAIVFVHGAGYLQNAHHWWSQYYREYMFHNFLVDNGYTVLDIDYRGSSGYGRDWRTAIYRHMGGRDLDDHINGAKYLVEQQGIDKGRIGIYGGSYGGFITLMALFTKPGVFAAGAALRPVTDWAHYNHGYTSNILNTPVQDSLSYVRSSPIYYASGLKDALLICHGMIDDNVHFQDVVRLSQKLIELGKDNWSVAFYPLESHSFIEASSWTDEYRRIYELFEQKLNGAGK
jgi:dipeptidyl aminopeptidase/acylaminoacyl peptidase